ncbi:hypothetical protein BKA62DRAFT_703902 [Auriculariales sp. MPI-PUGE-AT-0066]|nr:hypothetical protein BKA62DRAFT_703902 [Auriculariales sp. MPI-PUGE-AT-0066]
MNLTVQDVIHDGRMGAQPDTGSGATALTLEQIVKLVESGQTDDIPNNKTINSSLSDKPVSKPTIQPRAKPWERA